MDATRRLSKPASDTASGFDFDFEPDLRGSASLKWEFSVRSGVPEPFAGANPDLGDEQVLPMWVADMDFPAAPAIQQALHDRVERGVFGYPGVSERYLAAVCGWMQQRQGWQVEPEWIVPTPGVVSALHLIVRRFSDPGDKVLIQRPVYHPFGFAAENNDRELSVNSLRQVDKHYEMDFDDLANRVSDPKLKIALLCSPHNPVGRVWRQDELARFAEICADQNVLVVADEIHSDLSMPGHRFVPYATAAPAAFAKGVVCTAPSKAFNLAGLKSSNIIIPDESTRTELKTEMRATGMFGPSLFGLIATEAAYTHGEAWLDAAVEYIDANLDHLETYLDNHLPELDLIRPEGTYLAWIDCRKLGLTREEMETVFFEEARIYLDEGHVFGDEGEGFVRLNVACSRRRLQLALERIANVVRNRRRPGQ